MTQSLARIRTIVFDFGGVLIDWNPRYLYRKLFFGNEMAMESFLVEIGFTEWNLQQDAGRAFSLAVTELIKQFPTYADLIQAYDERWEESIAGPLQATVDLLLPLKQAGFELHGLSNWSSEKFAIARTKYEFFQLFETILLSGDVKLLKPDPRIYAVLLERIGRSADLRGKPREADPGVLVSPVRLSTHRGRTCTSLAPTMPATSLPSFSYPIGTPGRPLGTGFFIRHGVEVENTWYNPGYWHTGEDWYAVEGDTAGARVYAVADGEVVYAGANYPGRVVIVRHADNLFSMYGHLDPQLNVEVGQHIVRGALIGTVLRRGDATPNHLHFEIRTFLTAREVNGAAPRYPFRCGVDCPPGRGYWPIAAPDLPSDVGWLNPTHVINRRMLPEGAISEVVVSTKPVSNSVTFWSAPPSGATRTALDTLELRPSERYALLEVHAGAEGTRETSALAYRLWYRIELPRQPHRMGPGSRALGLRDRLRRPTLQRLFQLLSGDRGCALNQVSTDLQLPAMRPQVVAHRLGYLVPQRPRLLDAVVRTHVLDHPCRAGSNGATGVWAGWSTRSCVRR